MKFDNAYTGTLWMATNPKDPSSTLDDRMSGNFIGGNGEKLRINAKKQGSNWAWEVMKMPVAPKRTPTVVAAGSFGASGMTKQPGAEFDPPCIVGTLTGKQKGQGTIRMVGFLKSHEFKGEYIQVTKARVQTAPSKIKL
jgi:hypothetical protein